MTAIKSFIFKFEDVEVREREFCLTKAGKELTVEPKAFRVLLFLLHSSPRVVTKEELLNAVWSDAAVTENSLTRTILKLRRVLEDDAHEPRFIETVATVGYRFACKVDIYEDIPASPAPLPLRSSTFGGKGSGATASLYVLRPAHAPALPSAAPEPVAIAAAAPANDTRGARWPWLLAGVLVAAGLACLAWYLHRPLPALRISQYTQITHDSRQKALIGTDGARLFVNIYPSEQPLAEVSITGGVAAPIPLAFPNPWVYDLSPDGTALLATSFDKGIGSLWSVGSAGSPLRHLADGNKGDIDGAVWSPDGKSVAYSTSNGDIHFMHTDGTGARVLGTVPYRTQNAMFEQISWSPDGKTIRFDRNNRIYEVSLDGSAPHPFLPGWRPTSWQCCGRWTPDGNFYLFLVWDNPRNAYRLIPPFQIWALDERHGRFRRASAEPFQLTSGPTRWCRPVPARDGRKIFARGVNLNGELDRLDQRSHQLQPYLGGISAEGVTFSSDGKSVAYVTYPEGILWRADRDGNNRIQLTDPPLYPVSPRWSPDGSQILFAAADSAGDFHSYILSSQGGTPQPILPGSRGEEDPNWSPDGRRIVFISWEGERGNSKVVTRILDLASRQVTTLPGNNVSPRWSPTGRFLAGLPQDTDELTLFDFETQRWSVLQKGEADFPTWSHDGQFIYFLRMSGDSGVYRIRPTGGSAERVVDLKGFHHAGYDSFSYWMDLDPDDNPMLLRDLGGDDIYALTLEEK